MRIETLDEGLVFVTPDQPGAPIWCAVVPVSPTLAAQGLNLVKPHVAEVLREVGYIRPYVPYGWE